MSQFERPKPAINFPNGVQHKEHPVTNPHMNAAIEAQSDLKQEISDYLSEYHGGRDTDLDANEAAEHIVSKLAEPRLREMIAQEIRDHWDACGVLINSHNAARIAFDNIAHQIAKEEQE